MYLSKLQAQLNNNEQHSIGKPRAEDINTLNMVS